MHSSGIANKTALLVHLHKASQKIVITERRNVHMEDLCEDILSFALSSLLVFHVFLVKNPKHSASMFDLHLEILNLSSFLEK